MPNGDHPPELPGRVEALEGDVQALADGHLRHSQILAKLTEERDPSRVRSWLQADDEEGARLLLEDLAGWVGAVWIQYYPDGQLPECWLYHPPIVEELVAQMGAHRACFRKGGTWQAFTTWHDRRPGVAARIRSYAPSCTLDLHQPGEQFDPADVPTVPRLQDISMVAAQWTSTGTAPYPTSTPI